MKFWEEEIKANIKQIKLRIKLYEKRGMGTNTMEEKSHLQKIERLLELWKQNG